jgi:hypothetical protein
MISHKHKFIFVHIPKTAGTTITSSLEAFCEILPMEDRTSPYYFHKTATETHEYFVSQNWNYSDYFKFAFVRNPWDRTVSLYHYLNKRYKRLLERDALHEDTYCKQIANINSFNDFIGNIDKFIPSSYEKYYMVNGTIAVNFIGKLENLQEDFNIVCDKIGIPQQKLPHKNSTKHNHYSEYYDDATKQIVAEKYAKDIEYFGYKFGE